MMVKKRFLTWEKCFGGDSTQETLNMNCQATVDIIIKMIE